MNPPAPAIPPAALLPAQAIPPAVLPPAQSPHIVTSPQQPPRRSERQTKLSTKYPPSDWTI